MSAQNYTILDLNQIEEAWQQSCIKLIVPLVLKQYRRWYCQIQNDVEMSSFFKSTKTRFIEFLSHIFKWSTNSWFRCIEEMERKHPDSFCQRTKIAFKTLCETRAYKLLLMDYRTEINNSGHEIFEEEQKRQQEQISIPTLKRFIKEFMCLIANKLLSSSKQLIYSTPILNNKKMINI